jgi:hypothetical protein
MEGKEEEEEEEEEEENAELTSSPRECRHGADTFV